LLTLPDDEPVKRAPAGSGRAPVASGTGQRLRRPQAASGRLRWRRAASGWLWWRRARAARRGGRGGRRARAVLGRWWLAAAAAESQRRRHGGGGSLGAYGLRAVEWNDARSRASVKTPYFRRCPYVRRLLDVPSVGMKTVGNGIYSVISFLVVFLWLRINRI
jgi:hypothetical protein